MKKILASLLMIACVAGTASAKMKSKKRASGHIPYAENPVIDHSKDVAFSSNWAHLAVSPAPDADFRIVASPSQLSPLVGKTFYYGYPLSNYTLYGSYPVSMNGPYLGKDAPSYDGALKNAYRNIRANNESEPLPPNDGGK